MRLLLLLALAASPLGSAGAEERAPLLVANADGSVTITRPIESAPAALRLRAGRPMRAAAQLRARAEGDREVARAYDEAVAQTREAARVPSPR